MKNIISITALLLFTCLVTGQIRVTPEGYPLLPKKPSIITLVDNDSIMVQTDDGIVRDISFGDFKSLLPSTGTGSEFIKVTPAEYLALTPTELAENDYMIVDSKASVSIDFMYESIYDTDGNGAVDDSEMLGGQLPSHYLDNTVRTDEEIEDIIGSKIVGGTNVTTSYNDTTGETTINSTASGGTSDHGGLTGLGDDDHPQYFNQPRGDARYLQSEVDGSTTNELQTISKVGSTVTLSNGGGSFNDSNTQRTNEEIEDIIGNKIVAGTDINVSYNDTTGETTINSTVSSVTQADGSFSVTVGGTSGGTFGTITPVSANDGYYIRSGDKVEYWIEITASNPSGISGALYIEPDFAFTPRTTPTTYPANIGGVAMTGGTAWTQLYAFMNASNKRISFNHSIAAPSNNATSAYPAPTSGAITIRINGTFLIN